MEMIGEGGYLPRNMKDGSTAKIVKVHVLVSVSLNFAQSSLMPLIITLQKQASKMHSASPGAMGAVIVQTQFMHLCICKNLSVTLTGDRHLDSIMRQRLTNMFFLWYLSCLLYLAAWECTWKPGGRALACCLLHCGGGCHQNHLLFEL